MSKKQKKTTPVEDKDFEEVLPEQKEVPTVEEMNKAFNEASNEPQADILPFTEGLIADIASIEKEPEPDAPITKPKKKTIMEQAADMALINEGKLKRA